MPNKTAKLEFHPLVTKLTQDSPEAPNVRMVEGFLGKGSAANRVRVYGDLNLCSHIEVDKEHVRHVEPLGTHTTSPSAVWIDADATVQYVRPTEPWESPAGGKKPAQKPAAEKPVTIRMDSLPVRNFTTEVDYHDIFQGGKGNQGSQGGKGGKGGKQK